MTKEQLAQEYAADKLRPVGAANHYIAGYAACEARYADLLAAAETAIYNLRYVAFNYNGKKLEHLKPGLIESVCPAESALISARDLKAILTTLKAK